MANSADRSTAENLIDVAGEIFASKGASATVREICSAAGCSVAAINYHFGDKQQLYLRCVQTACEQKQHLFPLPKSEEAASPEQLLRRFLRAMTSRIAGQSNLSWHNTLMLREVLAPSHDVAGLLASYFRADFERLDQLLSKLLGGEDDVLETRRQLAVQIVARCMFIRTGRPLRQMLDISCSSNEEPEQYADQICESILLQLSAMQRGGQSTTQGLAR